MNPCPCCHVPRTAKANPGFEDVPGFGHQPMKISYACPRCGEEWEDFWCSAVDGECPACGCDAIEPVEWETLHDDLLQGSNPDPVT